MRRALLALSVFFFVPFAVAQNPAHPQNPKSQSARQALIEMFFGSAPNHLEKHLPDATRKSFQRMNSSEGQTFLAGLSSLSSQAKAGGAKVETFDTGPIILTIEDGPNNAQRNDPSRMEVSVERDDLIGEQDEIELALHLPRDVTDHALPMTPHLTFAMKTEADVWRLTDITVTLHLPLADPDFLKSLEDSQRKKNEQMTIWSMSMVNTAELTYHAARGAYACSLSQLGQANKPGEPPVTYIDAELASGKKAGYVFVISACDGSHYKVVAEPAIADSGARAFCSDERGSLRASADGKATTCLSSGEQVEEKFYTPLGVTTD